MRARIERLKRNDQCHCGSGKKYKRCCLLTEEAEAAEQILKIRRIKEAARE